jgi:hypothetical protein
MSADFRMLVRNHHHEPGLWIESASSRSEVLIIQDQAALEKYIVSAQDEGWKLVSHTVKHTEGSKELIPSLETLIFSRVQPDSLPASRAD